MLPRFIAEDYVVHEADEYTVGFLPPAAYDAIEER